MCELCDNFEKAQGKNKLQEVPDFIVDRQKPPTSPGPELSDLLNAIPQQPQRQDSTLNQIADLLRIANHLGMYDAYDAIMERFK